MFHIAFLDGENFGKAKIKVVFDIFKCFKNKIIKNKIQKAWSPKKTLFIGMKSVFGFCSNVRTDIYKTKGVFFATPYPPFCIS
jgi:hypothetical protein